jgi:serine/threonine protein kinase
MPRTSQSPLLGTIETKRNRYSLQAKLGKGTLSRVYAALDEAGTEVVIKVVSDEANNTMMLNEIGILKAQKIKLVPEVLDSFKTEDGRIATVFARISGFDVTKIRVADLHRAGTKDFYHLGWLVEHQLGLLRKLHRAMIVHGNIQPQHVMVTPQTHDVQFIDYCFARSHPTPRDRVSMWTDWYSAPEIRDGVPPLPGMDIYSVGKVAVLLAGGNPETGEIPLKSGLDTTFREFIYSMIEPNYLQRPRDAFALAKECWRLRGKIWGPPAWVDFTV